MTIAAQMPTLSTASSRWTDDGVSWRTLRSGMWAARRDGHHLGTIEQRRRWLASDADSEPIGRFRTFREAQAAVLDPAAHRSTPRRPSAAPALVVAGLGAAVVATAALTSTALAAAAGWVWLLLP